MFEIISVKRTRHTLPTTHIKTKPLSSFPRTQNEITAGPVQRNATRTENYKAGRVIHGPVIPADFYQQLSAERWLLNESPISLQPRDSSGHTWLWSQTVPDVYTAVVLSILPLAISFKRKRVLHQTNDLVLKLNGSLAFITEGAYDFRSGFHLRIFIFIFI